MDKSTTIFIIQPGARQRLFNLMDARRAFDRESEWFRAVSSASRKKYQVSIKW